MRKTKRIDVRVFEYELDALKMLCEKPLYETQEQKLIRQTVKGLSNRLKREYDEETPKSMIKQPAINLIKFLILYLTGLSVIGTIVLIYSIFK